MYSTHSTTTTFVCPGEVVYDTVRRKGNMGNDTCNTRNDACNIKNDTSDMGYLASISSSSSFFYIGI